MLFDLRGRGRRRAVRVIYMGLALLFGSGLVLFGVGGGIGGGGILSSVSKEGEGGGGATYAAQIKKYTKLTQTQPSNASAWENLAKAIYHEAGHEPYTTSAGQVTNKGKELFKQAAQAWTSYLALNPPKPNTELAQLMASVYSVEGLNEPAKEVEVLQIVVAARPTSASYYSQLAIYAYRAKNARVGDLASEKAVSLAPAAQRVRLKKELAEVKANPTGSGSTSTTASGSSTGSSENTGTTITVGGKTYSIPSKDLHVTSTGATTSTKKK